MPSFTPGDLLRVLSLTNLTRRRLEAISFFVAGLLLCAWLIQLVWNGIPKDLKVLPRLSFPKALGVVFLWGMLFTLVLTMISGARELMTPGAWEKRGVTYRLIQEPPAPREAWSVARRLVRLETMQRSLREHAGEHEGRFPRELSEVQSKDEFLSAQAGPVGSRYIYVAGRRIDQSEAPLVYEPESEGPRRLVLMSRGKIRWMSSDEWERTVGSDAAHGGHPSDVPGARR